MSEELKPCPFCGVSDEEYLLVENRYGWKFVSCDNCMAAGPLEKEIWEATKAWNTRTQEAGDE